MKWLPLFAVLLALIAFIAAPPAAPQVAAQEAKCDVELVLAMDVSRSVSTREYALQIGGLAQALSHPEVMEAIEFLPGGVMATVMIWGDASQQKQTTPWTHLTGPADILPFAQEVAKTKRHFGFTLTGLGKAMIYADELTRTNPRECRRRIIDISGDGVWNHGPRPSAVWRTGISNDVTINGLVILGATPSPLPFYEAEVIGGYAAFVEVAEDFDDYAPAILRKLLRELSPSLSSAPPAPDRTVIE